MRATAVEYRLRFTITALVLVLGFWSPWIEAWGIGSRTTLEMWLALQLSHIGLLSFKAAIALVIILAALTALKGAALRVWGTAYLGEGKYRLVRNPFFWGLLGIFLSISFLRPVSRALLGMVLLSVCIGDDMQAGRVLAEGPYLLVRNPLYWGLWCMFLAMSFLMPVSGALVAMVLLSVFLFRLILGEEAFLTSQLGDEYREYQRTVPRLFPHLKSIPLAFARRESAKPQWLHAMIYEINPIGVFLIMAILSWNYDDWLMIRAIVVCFGISIVVRAALPAGHGPLPSNQGK
jgi:protein-S-isoprenylcysteine O-methyltransferase Ste14